MCCDDDVQPQPGEETKAKPLRSATAFVLAPLELVLPVQGCFEFLSVQHAEVGYRVFGAARDAAVNLLPSLLWIGGYTDFNKALI